MTSRVPTSTQVRLLSLACTERSGREIAALYEERFGQAISYGTLYTTLRRLKEDGMVTMRKTKGDGRARHYRITASGRHALERGLDHAAETAGVRKWIASAT